MTDWSVHPGEVLREALAERGMSQAEFATRMGISKKHANQIVQGHSGFSATTALGMERVLGIKAEVWLRMLADHELWKARRS